MRLLPESKHEYYRFDCYWKINIYCYEQIDNFKIPVFYHEEIIV